MYGLDEDEAIDLRSTQSTPDRKDRDGPKDLLRRRSLFLFKKIHLKTYPSPGAHRGSRACIGTVWNKFFSTCDVDRHGREGRPSDVPPGWDVRTGFATTWVPQKGACINTTTQNHCYRYYHRNHANHNNRHPEPLSFKPFLDRIC